MRHPDIVKAEALVNEARELVSRVAADIRERNKGEYQAAGGCLSCYGSGEVRCFDTYYECSHNVGTRGNVYDPSVRYGGDGPQTTEDQRALDDAKENLALAETTLRSAIALHDVDVGVTVRVVKGRKVKVGTVGVVTGVYDGQWGTRVGLRVDGEPKPVYTAIDNVLALTERFDGTHMLPDLYGSDKQVAWARKIREDAIKSGRVTVEQARNIGSARHWIDNRPGAERAA